MTLAGSSFRLSPLLDTLRPLLAAAEVPVHLVGGAVRDALLGKESHDLDFVVPHDAIALTFRLANALRLPAYALDEERDTGRIVAAELGTMIDIARYRGDELAADLRGRDFTINALALPATAGAAGDVIDLFGGLTDLTAGKVRIIHAGSIADDPIRALRAVRFSHKLGFTMTDETEAAARAAASGLRRISNERIRDELLRLMATPTPGAAVADLARLDLLAETLPEVDALRGVEQSSPHFEPVFDHTLRVLDFAAAIEGYLDGEPLPAAEWSAALAELLTPYRNALATHLERPVDGGITGRALWRMAALWHDVGKKPTQTIEADGRIRFLGHDSVGAPLASRRLGDLAFSNEATGHVAATVRGHMRPLYLANSSQTPSRRAIYRYYRELGTAGVDVALLSLADHLATYNGAGPAESWSRLLMVVHGLLAAYFDDYERLIAPPRLLSGSELIAELQLTPGPEVGRLLRLIEEAQAAGEVQSREDALQFARSARRTE